MSGVFDMAATLAEQLERLKGATDPDAIEMECKRADGMVKLTSTVLDMSKHQLEIVRTYDNATSDFCASASARMLGAGE